jgi:hypothetical protein
MAKTFTYKINSAPEALIATAKQKSAESGITFEGDAASGRIEGKGFAGEYMIEGDQISLTFDKKPAFVPWSLIESKLEEQVKKW